MKRPLIGDAFTHLLTVFVKGAFMQGQSVIWVRAKSVDIKTLGPAI